MTRLPWIGKGKLAIACLPLAFGSFLASTAIAQDFWTGASGGSWGDGTKWSLGAPPASASNQDAAFNLNSLAGYTVTLPATESANDVFVQSDNPTISLISSTLNVGSSSAAGQIDVGASAGQTGTLTIDAPNPAGFAYVQMNGGGNVNIGANGGNGQLTLNGADIFESTAANNFGLAVGFNGGTGEVNLNGANQSLIVGTIAVGNGGTGTTGGTGSLSLSNSYLTNDLNSEEPVGDLQLACAPNSQATAVINGSTLDVNGFIDVAGGLGASGGLLRGGTATLTVLNRSVISGDIAYIGANGGNGTVIGSLQAEQIFIGEAGTGNVTGGMSSGGSIYIGGNGGIGSVVAPPVSTIETIQGGVTVGADASGKPGTGTLELEGGSSCDLNDIDDPNPSPIPKNTLTIDEGGTVMLLTGGNATAADLIMSGGTLDIGLGGTSASVNGSISLTGSATFSGALDVTLTGGFEPVIGDSFDLFSFSSESGVFNSVTLPPLNQGTWDSSHLYADGTIAVVPEPIAIGIPFMAGALLLRRRRTHAPRLIVKSATDIASDQGKVAHVPISTMQISTRKFS